MYKTKKNYNNLVPVLLSDDKTKIISYPHPSDLKINNKFTFPVLLKDGYLLDRRGIGKNVAFLKFTYQEYFELKTLPTLAELYNFILDKNPLTELYDCGCKTNFTEMKEQINDLIDRNLLQTRCTSFLK